MVSLRAGLRTGAQLPLGFRRRLAILLSLINRKTFWNQ
jgi:hypothetical protein